MFLFVLYFLRLYIIQILIIDTRGFIVNVYDKKNRYFILKILNKFVIAIYETSKFDVPFSPEASNWIVRLA